MTTEPEQVEVASPSPIRCATTITLVLGVVLVLLGGKIRYSDDSGIPEMVFRLTKVRWEKEADMVIAGDSRAYMGVSPEHLATDIDPKLRVLNFGFNAQGYNDVYLAALKRTLDPASRQKRLLICITPRTLTPQAMIEHGYGFALNRDRSHNWLDRKLEYVYAFCRPMKPKDFLYGLFPRRKKKHFYREFYANGWMPGDRDPRKIGSGYKEYTERVFVNNFVNPKAVTRLMAFVRECSDEGIQVYGLRPPTCEVMVKLENELSGIDEVEIKRRFQTAGGIWLEPDPFAYNTFDDSHLTKEAAIEFTKWLSRAISEEEGGKDTGDQEEGKVNDR